MILNTSLTFKLLETLKMYHTQFPFFPGYHSPTLRPMYTKPNIFYFLRSGLLTVSASSIHHPMIYNWAALFSSYVYAPCQISHNVILIQTSKKYSHLCQQYIHVSTFIALLLAFILSYMGYCNNNFNFLSSQQPSLQSILHLLLELPC